jgi:hypothetical protein
VFSSYAEHVDLRTEYTVEEIAQKNQIYEEREYSTRT